MKILVYTYAIHGRTADKTKELVDAKETELKSKYPGIMIMVVPGPSCDGDKVHMIDMTPSPYPPNYTLGNPILAGYPYPITTGTTGVPIHTTTTGGGYTVGSAATLGSSHEALTAASSIKFSTKVDWNAHDAAVKAESTDYMKDWIATGHESAQVVTGTSSYTTGENVVKFPPK